MGLLKKTKFITNINTAPMKRELNMAKLTDLTNSRFQEKQNVSEKEANQSRFNKMKTALYDLTMGYTTNTLTIALMLSLK